MKSEVASGTSETDHAKTTSPKAIRKTARVEVEVGLNQNEFQAVEDRARVHEPLSISSVILTVAIVRSCTSGWSRVFWPGGSSSFARLVSLTSRGRWFGRGVLTGHVRGDRLPELGVNR